MGRTITEVRGSRDVRGAQIEIAFDVSFDATYVANGESFTPRQAGGLRNIIDVQSPGPLTTGHSIYWDRAGQRLKVLTTSTGAEVTGGTNLSAITGARVVVKGW